MKNLAHFYSRLKILVPTLLFLSLLSCGDDDSAMTPQPTPDPDDNNPAEIALRISEVDTDNNTITLKNFGEESVDATSFWICILRAYQPLSDIGSASDLVIGSDETIVLTTNLNGGSSDIGLYQSSLFGEASAMLDFMQYGQDVGASGRVSVAVTKGIWSNGDFVGDQSPYVYIGDGTQNGASFWEGN